MTEVATPGTAAPSHMAAGDARDSNREVHVRGGDEYVRFKKLQQQLEFLNTMEDYVVRALLWRGRQRLTRACRKTSSGICGVSWYARRRR